MHSQTLRIPAEMSMTVPEYSFIAVYICVRNIFSLTILIFQPFYTQGKETEADHREEWKKKLF